MQRWMKIAMAAGGGLVFGGVVVVAAATWRWNREVDRTVARLNARTGPQEDVAPSRFLPAELSGLPAPVARYFTFALTPGQPLIRRAELRQDGEFLMGPDTWKPCHAQQHVTVKPPGLVWDATIDMAPFMPVRVQDSYLEGEGRMHGRVLSLVKVVDMRGTPEMAVATLQRYLAEALWFPTALLPSAGVSWTAIDDASARATLVDGPTRASVEFHFNARGEIVQMTAERYRDVDGTPVLSAWRGQFRDYTRVHGVMVPARAEIGWDLPEGYLAYWRGRLYDFRYEYAAEDAAPIQRVEADVGMAPLHSAP